MLADLGLRAVLRGAGRPPQAGRLPGHLPHLRGGPRPDRPGGHAPDAGPAGGDRRRGPPEADPRQRLQGRGRRAQGPAREHRLRPHRRGALPRADEPPGDRGRPAGHRDPGRQGGPRGGRGPAQAPQGRLGPLVWIVPGSRALAPRLAALSSVAMAPPCRPPPPCDARHQTPLPDPA
ncbi:hypothetical protein SGPA1_31203 [Streptomyces misionensis JCM 4497]